MPSRDKRSYAPSATSNGYTPAGRPRIEGAAYAKAKMRTHYTERRSMAWDMGMTVTAQAPNPVNGLIDRPPTSVRGHYSAQHESLLGSL